MAQIEGYPRFSAAEHPGPHSPQNEGRPAVVAEGQQPLGLSLGALPLLIELDGGAGPHGIAPHKAQGQGGGTGAVHPEQGCHDGMEQPPQAPGQTQFHHQRGQHEEGEQGGDHHVGAQGHTLPHRGGGLGGPGDERQGGAQQPQPHQRRAQPGLCQQTAHRPTSQEKTVTEAYVPQKKNLPVPRDGGRKKERFLWNSCARWTARRGPSAIG